MKIGLMLASILMGGGLSACATLPPKPQKIEFSVLSGEPVPALNAAIERAHNAEQEYNDRAYLLVSEKIKYHDVPLIGAAAATGGAILFEGGTDLLSGLALGTAVITGLKTYSNNDTKTPIYVQAADAMSCVKESGLSLKEAFEPNYGSKTREALTAYEQVLRALMARGRDLITLLETNSGTLAPDDRALSGEDKATRRAQLTEAISNAEDALKLAAAAQKALHQPAVLVDSKTTAIEGRLINRLAGATPDVTTITNAIIKAAEEKSERDKQAEKQESGSAADPQTVASVQATTSISDLPSAVVLNRLRLTGSELAFGGKPYADAAGNLDVCLAKAG